MISDKQKQQLISEAKKATKNVYPKDLPYAYGAAVLTSKGNIYGAANYITMLIILVNQFGEIKEIDLDELMLLPWPEETK